jgi:hypothetical protein
VKKSFSMRAMVFAVLACFAALSVPAFGQDKPVDMKKLLAEIIGDYEFVFEGQSLIVLFTEVDGKLFGALPGETPVEIRPIEGKPLSFDVTVAESGDYYQMEFVRNDKGVIDKCVVTTMGETIEGTKIIK